jgi:hypothetical protein
MPKKIDTDRINYLLRLGDSITQINNAKSMLDKAWKIVDPDDEIAYKLYRELNALLNEAEKKFHQCWKELL